MRPLLAVLLIGTFARAASAEDRPERVVDHLPSPAPRAVVTTVVPPAPTPVPPAPPAPPAPTGPRWYGWQTLLLDTLTGGAALVGFGLMAFDNDPPATRHLMALPYGLGGYLLHRAHDRPVYGLASGIMRAALPSIIAVKAREKVASDMLDDPRWWTSSRTDTERGGHLYTWLVSSYLIALISMTAVDTALSWEGLPEPRRTTSFVPHLTLTGREASVGVVGAF
jgi:hypothetical protein